VSVSASWGSGPMQGRVEAWDSTDLKEVHRVGGLKEGLHLAGGGGGRLKEGRSKVR
jgi:hypothetical protein